MLVCFSVSCNHGSIDYYIFSDLSEVKKLESSEQLGVTVVKLSSPDGDKNLGDLKYNDFFAADYNSEELNFRIFAYEFENSDIAKEYFKNIKGSNDGLETNFLASWSLFGFSLTVIDENKAYSAYTSVAQAETLKGFLGELFSVKLPNK